MLHWEFPFRRWKRGTDQKFLFSECGPFEEVTAQGNERKKNTFHIKRVQERYLESPEFELSAH